MNGPLNIFWFRRDLRIHDNVGFYKALQSRLPILPLFIFDTELLQSLPKDDPRVQFIYKTLQSLHAVLHGALLVEKGKPETVLKKLLQNYTIQSLFANHDYEPYALKRDQNIHELMDKHSVSFVTYKDQVIFEKEEIVKKDGKPYTLFTPYKNCWLQHFKNAPPTHYPSEKNLHAIINTQFEMPSLDSLPFKKSHISVLPYDSQVIKDYAKNRDFPALRGTSLLGPHLRFGTVSIRNWVKRAETTDPIFLNELIWREFFMQILYHFPKVTDRCFKSKYDNIPWLNAEKDFNKWCLGETGYPLVDAGMRQLNETGYMHNRVRMVVASFLTKHLLIDWRWGEAYFAEKLLDFELSSNNGNWQWVAGCGCDSAPYFRIFNPIEQQKKFDPKNHYILKWLDKDDLKRPQIVEHKWARLRALATFKKGLYG